MPTQSSIPQVPNDPDPTSPAAQMGEFEAGNRGTLSGRNARQSEAIGQDDPVAAGSRQGRERDKATPAATGRPGSGAAVS